MNNIVVIYKSKYGATEKYALMLKEELACDIYDINNINKVKFEQYDSVIFAGGIYASGIAGLKVLRKYYSDLKDKKIAVFAVGASPFDQKASEQLKSHNLKDDLKAIPLFYGRGGWHESKMSFKDRTLCKMLKKMVSKQDSDSYEPWQEALLSAIGQEFDWTDKKYLISLIEYIKS